ncbi:MAG: type IV pilus assembly protein PilM [Tepidisphaeraceae bacterium]
MASPRSAWGIDIGNRALKAVKIVRTGDGIKVEDFDFIEHETILSQSGDNRDDLIKHALATFVGRKNIRGSTVAVGVSGQQSFARFIKLPPVEDKQLPSIVKFEALQQIPFPLDEVEWSYQLFSQPDSPDKEVGIFAMRKELVNAHVKQFTDVDLNVQVVQMNPLALYNAVQHDGRLDGTTAMIIDVGAENTDLIIAGNESIWLRSIPIGGNNFTEVIAKAFKLSQEKAEDMKRNISTSKYQKQIFQAMRPVFADLVAEIQRSIGFYGSVNRENKIGKIVALGGTFQLSSLAKYLNQNLQLEVERPNAPVAALPDDSKVAAEFTENILSLYSAYGLALQAIGDAKVSSSLLPSAIRREKMWKEKNKFFAAAAACVVAGVLAGPVARVTLDRLKYNSATGEVSAAESELAGIKADVEAWNRDVAPAGTAERAKFGTVAGITDGQALWPDLMQDLLNAIPKPQPELAAALAKPDASAIEKTPRPQRRIFPVSVMRSKYYHDLTTKLTNHNLRDFREELLSDQPGQSGATGGFGAPAVDPAAAAAAGTAKRGFLIYMKIVTPFDPRLMNPDQTRFVDEELKAAMESVRPSANRPKMKYKVEQCEALPFGQVRKDTVLVERMKADYTAYQAALKGDTAFAPSQPAGGFPTPGGFPGGGFPGGGPAAFPGGGGFPPQGDMAPPAAEGGMFPGATGDAAGGAGITITEEEKMRDAFLDPITKEPILDDHVIEVYLRVDLDPEEWKAPAPADPSAAPAAAPAAP